jgi:hypothetical protein
MRLGVFDKTHSTDFPLSRNPMTKEGAGARLSIDPDLSVLDPLRIFDYSSFGRAQKEFAAGKLFSVDFRSGIRIEWL